MAKRTGEPNDFPVSPGSSLAGDDKASNPYQVSHAVQMCLVAGVDHLHAVKFQHNFVPGAELSEDRRQLVQHFVGGRRFDQVSKALST